MKIPPSRLSKYTYVVAYAQKKIRPRLYSKDFLQGAMIIVHAKKNSCVLSVSGNIDCDNWEMAEGHGCGTIEEALLFAIQEYGLKVDDWTLHPGRYKERVYNYPFTLHDKHARRIRKKLYKILFYYKYTPRKLKTSGLKTKLV